MNEQLQKHARDILKVNLSKCTDGQRVIFKRMYALHGSLGIPIDDVVDNMPEETLDWAMQQVQRTVDGNEETENG